MKELWRRFDCPNSLLLWLSVPCVMSVPKHAPHCSLSHSFPTKCGTVQHLTRPAPYPHCFPTPCCSFLPPAPLFQVLASAVQCIVSYARGLVASAATVPAMAGAQTPAFSHQSYCDCRFIAVDDELEAGNVKEHITQKHNCRPHLQSSVT